jgi:SAM-dependent methyltransferase
MKCRHCNSEISLSLIDLGGAPPSNAYLTEHSVRQIEKYFPLHVLVCETCWLIQTEDYIGAEELFDSDYAYFSSVSSSWLNHAEEFVGEVIDRFHFDSSSLVIEVASNDGYLLQFVKDRGIPCLGIEPTASTAMASRQKGLEVLEEFFGTQLANKLLSENKKADLIVANNVLAHVPNINDFVAGFSVLLNPDGIASFEFPHILELIRHVQFDTIYHEHFSYLSLTAVEKIFNANGLRIFDVQKISTHGGSLRVFAQRKDLGKQSICSSVSDILNQEKNAGIQTKLFYSNFQEKANFIKDNLLTFLINAKKENKKVIAYGAAAKGNTLLNYAGVKLDLIPIVIDKNTEKQGKFMPGSHISIKDESLIEEIKPDYILILPWNIADEIIDQLHYVRSWGAQFVRAIPQLEIL